MFLIVLDTLNNAVWGSRSIFTYGTEEYCLNIENQKLLSLRHSQYWHASVLLTILHLSQSDEVCGKILCSLCFEYCNLCITLNWISCSQTLIEHWWILFQALFRILSLIVILRSSFHFCLITIIMIMPNRCMYRCNWKLTKLSDLQPNVWNIGYNETFFFFKKWCWKVLLKKTKPEGKS